MQRRHGQNTTKSNLFTPALNRFKFGRRIHRNDDLCIFHGDNIGVRYRVREVLAPEPGIDDDSGPKGRKSVSLMNRQRLRYGACTNPAPMAPLRATPSDNGRHLLINKLFSTCPRTVGFAWAMRAAMPAT